MIFEDKYSFYSHLPIILYLVNLLIFSIVWVNIDLTHLRSEKTELTEALDIGCNIYWNGQKLSNSTNITVDDILDSNSYVIDYDREAIYVTD